MTGQRKKKKVLDTLLDPDGKVAFRAPPAEMYERLVMGDFGRGYKVRIFNLEFPVSVKTYVMKVNNGER